MRAEAKVPFLPLPVWTGVTYATDTDQNLKNYDLATNGVGGDLFMKISPLFLPYTEVAKYLDKEEPKKSYGTSFTAGIRGGMDFFNYRFEYRNIGDGFKVGLYDPFYENMKLRLYKGKITYNMSESKAYSGYMGTIGLNAGEFLSAKALYENYGDKDGQGLGLTLNGKYQRIRAGFDYKQKNIVFDKDFKIYATKSDYSDNETNFINSSYFQNTYYSGYVVYPINAGVDLKLSLTKRPGEKEFTTFMTSIVF